MSPILVFQRQGEVARPVHDADDFHRVLADVVEDEVLWEPRHAQQIAAHESPRTTKLYDRTNDELTLDEIERIQL